MGLELVVVRDACLGNSLAHNAGPDLHFLRDVYSILTIAQTKLYFRGTTQLSLNQPLRFSYLLAIL